MATALDLINEWVAESTEKQSLWAAKKGLVARWLNQASLRYADKSEMLRGVWTPTLDSEGKIALSSDFLRELSVLASDQSHLRKIDYQDGLALNLTGATEYSIYNGYLYVWGGESSTFTIPYVKKPTELTTVTILTADLPFPTEFHYRLLDFMNMRFERHYGKMSFIEEMKFNEMFASLADEDGTKMRFRRDGLITTNSSKF